MPRARSDGRPSRRRGSAAPWRCARRRSRPASATVLAQAREDGRCSGRSPTQALPLLRVDGTLRGARIACRDLEGHRARLREAFGNAMSDEFVEVILGKLIEALRPSPFDQLEEPTLNAALAIIASMQPQSELQALLAVQIIATGFSGLRFLRQSVGARFATAGTPVTRGRVSQFASQFASQNRAHNC